VPSLWGAADAAAPRVLACLLLQFAAQHGLVFALHQHVFGCGHRHLQCGKRPSPGSTLLCCAELLQQQCPGNTVLSPVDVFLLPLLALLPFEFSFQTDASLPSVSPCWAQPKGHTVREKGHTCQDVITCLLTQVCDWCMFAMTSIGPPKVALLQQCLLCAVPCSTVKSQRPWQRHCN